MRRLPARIIARIVLLPTAIRPWHRWPSLIGEVMLGLGLRADLRQHNLHDVRRNAPPVGPARRAREERDRSRDALGRRNDLNDDDMGMVQGRFGRNFPPERTWPEPMPRIMEPNPRTVSRELLARDEFQPATSLNVLAAAWIQFMVHGWFNHGNPIREDPWKIPLAPDDTWPEGFRLDGALPIRRTRPDPTWSEAEGRPPTYRTSTTHWWDGSQLYGSDPERLASVRGGAPDGHIALTPEGLLPYDPERKVDHTGFNDDYWLGLSLLHTLFAREHNAICDRLRQEYPGWSDDQLFQHAQLINSALMAKIHTVEWTPAMLPHAAVTRGMHSSWYGLLGPRFRRRFRGKHFGDILSGMPGSSRDHFDVPYSLTEEFVAVYRMHPLVPDRFAIRSAADDTAIKDLPFYDVQGANTRGVMDSIAMADLIYSLGTSHPGAITLHNHPSGLREFAKVTDGETIMIDLAALDVMRDRERGVPRYNDFREGLRMPRVKRFEDLTDNPEWAEQLRRVYEGDVDRVDAMVGMLAEPLLPGFAFSETAFRIFILMAGRRITSDRFLTDDYKADVYTQTGLDWIDNNTLSSVVLRHFPQLAPALRGMPNAFAPWHRRA
ncbi:MAG: peroxidase [Dehalococcoidia bacterium]|nr:peroxidase [Dehalococcoidia bacterium]